MELRVVEIAHAKGLTMASIAKQIGISRVNLSNSLNGNPTLSRLREVAKILEVEVSELFKPFTTEDVICSYIEMFGDIVKITSMRDIERVLEKIHKRKC